MNGNQPAPLDARWRRGRRCQGSDATCVDVAIRDALVAVRDSKDPDGGVLRFTIPEWQVFLDGVRDGEFEPPAADQHADQHGKAAREAIS